MMIRVVIADDHRIVVSGLRSLLERVPDMEVVGEAADGRHAVELVLEKRPNVVLMDVSMSGLNGIEATRQILALAPATKVLALSMHIEQHFVSAVLEAGASGYLLKDCAYEELVHAIRLLMVNQSYLSPAITRTMLSGLAAPRGQVTRSAFAVLTGREREVLQMLAEGLVAKEIAGALNLSVKTVFSHRARIQEKLQIRTVAGLTKYALSGGLTTLEGTTRR